MARIDHYKPGDTVRARIGFDTTGAVNGSFGWRPGKAPIMNAHVDEGQAGILEARHGDHLVVSFELGEDRTQTVFVWPSDLDPN